jgi:hypothetical protein
LQSCKVLWKIKVKIRSIVLVVRSYYRIEFQISDRL